MYLTVIAWIYVVLLMSIAEATSVTGTVLGAVMTFLLYGVLPLSIVMYLMGTPSRRRAFKALEQQRRADAAASAAANQEAGSSQPDASGHAAGAADPTDPVSAHAAAAAVREKS